MKEVMKEIKNAEGKTIEYQYLNNDKLSNLETYHTHSFRSFYSHLLSLYKKDLDVTQDKLPLEFDIVLLEKLYCHTSFYRFDRYSQKFSIDKNDYEEIIYYNRLFQGIAIHSFLDICFDKMFQGFPATVKDMAEILVFFEDNNKLNEDRFKEINEKIIGCLKYVFEDNFYYNNEDNSRKIDIFKTLNKYKKFKYV